ncbi:uncharacterized protein LOC110227082 [Arabidopsis lyrata subsp. lyrata]|uniref:uncharacterized protein LOC110227082 n=1 Tax=Arabidopsis lyrata subsp. lyrata TaxID=81972 RepID=UPI000A29C204|nr:uncharacterized protein LOC110227082 [Arabidopsis lyrata subsp. lyrata]|eukprot:XP_020875872.1 uncharacterized protein LOC110227082 [Arabidopsis lyrata subsp. lyrata]
MDKLEELFLPQDIALKTAMVPTQVLEDDYVWAFNNNGDYSVKSGYWFITNHRLLPPVENIAQNAEINMLKRRIWNLKTEPKIKLFCWRALSGALAVAERLSTRGIPLDTNCQICGTTTETICHVLFSCAVSSRILGLALVPAPDQGFSSTSLLTNFSHLLNVIEDKHIPEQTRISIPWVLWAIWKNRNRTIFEGKVWNFQALVQKAYEDAMHWTMVNTQPSTLFSRQSTPIWMEKKWRKPQTGILKCNLNSSWINKESMCGGAWIVRDHIGQAKHHARDAFTPIRDRTGAELRCILWSLKALQDIHVSKMIMELDYAAAVNAVLQPSKWPFYRNWLTQIHEVAAAFESCTFRHIATNANLIARSISRSVIRDRRFQSYIALGEPSWLHNQVFEESKV